MSSLTETQTSFLRGLFRAAPDAAVCSLEQALAAEAEVGGAMGGVYDLVTHEASERRIRTAVFGPLVAMCRPTPSRAIRFPSRTIADLWEGLTKAHVGLTHAAAAACLRDDGEQAASTLYDQLCARAAAGLRDGDPAFALATETLGEAALTFAGYLDLTPIAREALARLPEWVGRLTEERTASARISYRDAVALADDAGPCYFEILFANLAEPWLILRVLSAVMDRPADQYVAVSELARFGEYVMEDIDLRLEAFAKFNPDDGRAAGIAAGEAIHIITQEIGEFESSIDVGKDGPWGRRLMKQRRAMASLAETRLTQIDKALDQALPLQMVRFGRGLRGQPKLAADPEPRMLLRAEGLLAFFDHSRNYASQSGFGAARAKAAEKLETRLDQYVEDLIDVIRAEEVEQLDRARAYLEASAHFMEAARGEKAAQIVRRRAAA